MKKILRIILLGYFLLIFCGIGMGEDTKFVGSRHSNKYHYTWCKSAQRINPSNLVTFDSPEKAIAAGYIPCKVCRPPVKSGEEREGKDQ